MGLYPVWRHWAALRGRPFCFVRAKRPRWDAELQARPDQGQQEAIPACPWLLGKPLSR
jgi:hypothetical protein